MGRMVEHYDAFVIHNPEGTDLAFVQEMAMILEGPKYNFKLFLPWRDLHSTENNEIEILAEILTKRCTSAVVVVSPNLLQSDVTSFLLSLIHAKYPSGRNNKVIPIMIEKCEMPTILQSVTVCDFTKLDMRCWVWQRMALSLQTAQTQRQKGKSKESRRGGLPDLLKGL